VRREECLCLSSAVSVDILTAATLGGLCFRHVDTSFNGPAAVEMSEERAGVQARVLQAPRRFFSAFTESLSLAVNAADPLKTVLGGQGY
jgi:hypothetical protein